MEITRHTDPLTKSLLGSLKDPTVLPDFTRVIVVIERLLRLFDEIREDVNDARRGDAGGTGPFGVRDVHVVKM
jgi:hypothetical protein